MACLIFLVSLCSCKSAPKTIYLFKKDGETAVEINSDYQPVGELAYFDIVINEAESIISNKLDCNIENAKQKLWNQEYNIYTYFESDVQESLNYGLDNYRLEMDSAATITDLNGNIIAAYSNSLNEVNNNASTPHKPHSSFKPLSIYAQALEKGIINWSTTYEDSPYTQLENSDGSKRNWPINANGKYSLKNVTVYYAIKRSLNTVAVKCLHDVGVNNSIDFLQKKLSVPMFYEQYNSTIHGEDEVIGNVALGYLSEGVSTVDMAGYYQMFATGGNYDIPKTIFKITDKYGKIFYKREYSSQKIISPYTADVMNLLMRGVTSANGTGANAFCKDIQVSGKTGTGDENSESWFVGITPELSLAIWHGQLYKNISPDIFSVVIKDVYSKNSELEKKFKMHSNLKPQVYCEESGMGVSSKCTSINLGYYSSETTLDVCNIH